MCSYVFAQDSTREKRGPPKKPWRHATKTNMQFCPYKMPRCLIDVRARKKNLGNCPALAPFLDASWKIYVKLQKEADHRILLIAQENEPGVSMGWHNTTSSSWQVWSRLDHTFINQSWMSSSPIQFQQIYRMLFLSLIPSPKRVFCEKPKGPPSQTPPLPQPILMHLLLQVLRPKPRWVWTTKVASQPRQKSRRGLDGSLWSVLRSEPKKTERFKSSST